MLNENGVVNVLDVNGNITSTYTPSEYGDVSAYGDGYVFTSLNVSDFDNNYDIYTIYDANGKMLHDFSVLLDGEPTAGMVGSVNYCGDGIFVISIGNGLVGYYLWYYCAKVNSLITGIERPIYNSIYNSSSDGIVLIDIPSHDPDEVGYRSSLLFLSADGTTSMVPIKSDCRWGWSASRINDSSILLYYDGDYGDDAEMIRYDLKTDKFTSLGKYYLERIYWDKIADDAIFNIAFVDGKVALPMRGSDGNSYAVIFDSNWNAVFEPIRCKEIIGFSSGRLILKHDDGYCVYDNNGSLIFDLSEIGFSKISAYSDGFAIVSSEEWYSNGKIEILRYINENGDLLFENIELNQLNTISLDVVEK